MNLDDVRKGGAFRRIHSFGALSSSKPSGSNVTWVPRPGEEIFVNFEPKQRSYIQNTENPPKALFGVRYFAYRQEPDDSFQTLGGRWSTSPTLQKAYIEFELPMEEDTHGGILMNIKAEEMGTTSINLDRDKLQGRFLITKAELEMQVN